MKKILAGIVMMAGLAVFADAANTLIYFRTVGPDTYADGSTVLDGERYALVWSQDGNFGGITADCTPVREGDRIIAVLSAAKGGCCPMAVYQIPSNEAPSSGVYEVYLLDTRVLNENGEFSGFSRWDDNNKPSVVRKASSAVSSYAAKTAGEGPAQNESSESSASAAIATAVPLAAQGTKPEVTAIKVDGPNVYITVKNTLPYLEYNVVGNDTIEGIDQAENRGVPRQGGANANEEITIVVPKKNSGKFFKVRRN